MKKIVLAAITMTLTTFNVISQDFRNATWGMSPSQVKSSETSELVEGTSDQLIYQTTLVGYDVDAIYFFASDKLTRANYVLKVKYINSNEYISDYDILNSILKKKYGEPLEDKVQWNTESAFKDYNSSWGFAIRYGELELYSIYRTLNSEIKIILSSEDYKMIHQIQYSSTNAELKRLEENKLLKDF